MLPDYPQTAGHCPHELHPTPCHSRGLGTRGHTTYSPHTTPRPAATALPAVPGGKRVDRDRMGAGSSQRGDAGKSWATPSAATEGGAAVAVAERAAQVQSEPRASELVASAHTGRRESLERAAPSDAS